MRSCKTIGTKIPSTLAETTVYFWQKQGFSPHRYRSPSQGPHSHHGPVSTCYEHGVLMAGTPQSLPVSMFVEVSILYNQITSVPDTILNFIRIMPGGIHAPIEEILRWPTPNYVSPTTRPNTILVLACVCGPVTFAMLMTRLWVRIYHQRNAGWDDWLIVAGTVRPQYPQRAQHFING